MAWVGEIVDLYKAMATSYGVRKINLNLQIFKKEVQDGKKSVGFNDFVDGFRVFRDM
jgi:hypothetical protein